VRFEVPTGADVRDVIFCVVISCSFWDRYPLFGGNCYVHIQGRSEDRGSPVPLERW
jgi:hypothetical protein